MAMACAEVRKRFMNQVKASLAKHSMLFILGEPGCKHSHILANLAETQLDCKVIQLHQSALELDHQISNVVGQAIDYGNIGIVLLTLGRISESHEQLLKAKTLFERLNAQAELRQIEELLAKIESGATKDGEDASHTR
jgi:hypothetical protein